MRLKRLPSLAIMLLLFVSLFSFPAYARQIDMEAGKQYTFEIPSNLNNIATVRWYKGGVSVQSKDSGVPDYKKFYYTASAADNNTELYFIAVDSSGNEIRSDVWTIHIVNSGNSTQTNSNATPVPTANATAPPATKPVITKNPTGETVKLGGSAKFIARAENYKSFTWRIVSSDTTSTIKANEASYYFPGLTVSGEDTDTLILSTIPKSIDGWIVECMFTNDYGSSFTTGAVITVAAEPTPTPSPAVTPTPSVVVSTPGATPETEHVHTSTMMWISDDYSHWQVCSCGEIMEKGEHDIDWEVVTEVTRTKNGVSVGTCKICGVSQTKIIHPDPAPVSSEIILLIFFVALGLGVLGVVIMLRIYIKSNRDELPEDDDEDEDEEEE